MSFLYQGLARLNRSSSDTILHGSRARDGISTSAGHSLEEPCSIIGNLAVSLHKFQAVTASQSPKSLDVREKKVMVEAPNCLPWWHEGLCVWICWEDLFRYIHFGGIIGEFAPHEGASVPACVWSLFGCGNIWNISNVHVPHLAGKCPVGIFGVCFMVSPQRHLATTDKQLHLIFDDALVSFRLIKHHKAAVNEVESLLLELTFRLQHGAWGAAEATTKHSAHVVHEDQGLAIMPQANNHLQIH